MKKIILSILTLMLLSAGAHAQNSESNSDTNKTFKHSLKVRPLNAYAGEYGVTYERVIKPKRSLNFYAHVLFEKVYQDPTIVNTIKIGNQLTSHIGIDYRFYLSKNKIAPIGWYAGLGPLAYHVSANLDSPNADINLFFLGAQAHSGYQWVYKSGISLSVNGGIEYNKALSSSIKGFGLDPEINFAVGYSWN